jgi:hypothetical protein
MVFIPPEIGLPVKNHSLTPFFNPFWPEDPLLAWFDLPRIRWLNRMNDRQLNTGTQLSIKQATTCTLNLKAFQE